MCNVRTYKFLGIGISVFSRNVVNTGFQQFRQRKHKKQTDGGNHIIPDIFIKKWG